LNGSIFSRAAIASIVANGDHPIEVGMIGREGMTGASIVLGCGDRAPHETYMQMAGQGLYLPANRLREAITKSSSLHRVLLCYVHDFLTQKTQTALANGRSKIEERLARWLLLAHDRIDVDEIRLTHEFSIILGGSPIRRHDGAPGARAKRADRATTLGHHCRRPRGTGGTFPRHVCATN